MSEIEAAQAELRDIVQKLGDIGKRLRGVTARLPREGSPEVQDAAIEIRSIVSCVLDESIDPAARDLRAAAEYRARAEKEEPEEEGA
jgi:hypothetical protein